MKSNYYFCLPTNFFSASVSPDGRYFVGGGSSREIYVWNIPNKQLEQSWQIGELHHFPDCNRVNCVAVAPDSKTLVIGGCLSQVWDIQTARKKRSYPVGQYWPLYLEVCQERGVVLTDSGDSITAWNLNKREKLWHVPHPTTTYNFAFSNRGDRFVSSRVLDDPWREWITLHKTETGEELAALAVNSNIRPHSVDWSHDTNLVATGGRGGVQVWEPNSRQIVLCIDKSHSPYLHEHLDTITGLKFLPGGEQLITAGGCVCLWDINSGNLLQTLFPRDDIHQVFPIKNWQELLVYSTSQRSIEIFSTDLDGAGGRVHE